MEKIKFIIPGLYEHYELNILFLTLLRAHPEFFYENVDVSAVFGNFQFSTWDGGRTFHSYYHASKELIEKLVYIYNEELKTPIRLVFTSNTITEEDCFDRFNNLVLQICHKDMNEIVVSSEILENYIRINYPKYTFISSTTKCLNTIDSLEKELEKDNYKMVCLDYNLNKNKKIINYTNEQNKQKMEFLINAICPPGCQNRKNHYYLNSLFSKSYGKTYQMKECGIYNSTLYPQNSNNNLTPDEVFEYYKKGFNNFKLEGRTFSQIEALLSLIKYTIKPEYALSAILYFKDELDKFDINNYSYNI